MEKFYGCITAIITPFNKNGVDFDKFSKIIDYQIKHKVDGIVVLGTTGEPSTMSDEEKEKVVEFVIKKAKNKLKIIVGVGNNNTQKAINFSKKAEKLGADGLIAVTPYYNKCTQEGIYLYYKAICNSVQIPVIAYNVPSRTGVNISPETVEKLATIENLIGIKDARNNMAEIIEVQRRIRGKIDLFSGDDFLNLPILSIGGAGVISVISNIAPTLVKNLYSSVKKNDFQKANEINDKLIPLTQACFSEVNPIPIKAAYNILGFNVGIPRPPLTKISKANKKKLKYEIERLKLND